MCAFKIRPIAIDPAPEWDAPWLFNRRMGINAPAPGASLDVASSGSAHALIARGRVIGQAGNLQRWQDANGNVLLNVESDGDLICASGSIYFGSDATTKIWNPGVSSNLQIRASHRTANPYGVEISTTTANTGSTQVGLYLYHTKSYQDASIFRGVQVNTWLNSPNAQGGGTLEGMMNMPRWAGGTTLGYLRGYVCNPYIYTTGTVTEVVNFQAQLALHSGTITSYKGFFAEASHTQMNADRVSTAVGMQIALMGGKDVFGIYLNAQQSGTRQSYGLFSLGALDYHGGRVGIGTTGTVGRLTVRPSGTASPNDQRSRSGGAWPHARDCAR